MDCKGAQELARLLAARNGSVPEPEPPRPLAARDAAPIFHWFGIEPGNGAAKPPAPDGPAAEPASA